MFEMGERGGRNFYTDMMIEIRRYQINILISIGIRKISKIRKEEKKIVSKR